MMDESLEICIAMICNQFGIDDYTINEDGSIDVIGDLLIVKQNCETLPITFNKVSGSFLCTENPNLISLMNGPKHVGGNITIGINPNLKSLGDCVSPQSSFGKVSWVFGNHSEFPGNNTVISYRPKAVNSIDCTFIVKKHFDNPDGHKLY